MYRVLAPRLLDLVELVDDAGQVAAEEVVVVDRVTALAGAVRPLDPLGMALDGVVLVALTPRLRVVALVAVPETLGEDVVVDDVGRPVGHAQVFEMDGLAVAAHALGVVGQGLDHADAHRALLARPVDAVAVVLQRVAALGRLELEPVAVDAGLGEALAGDEEVAVAAHRHACQRQVVELLLVAAHAALLDHQGDRARARRGDAKAQLAAARLRAEGPFVLQVARVEARRQRHLVGDGALAGVDKGLGADLETRPALGIEAQAQGVRAAEGAREIALAALRLERRLALGVGRHDAGLGPGGVADLEVVAARQLDVQQVGVAVPAKRVVVERGPVVHGAAQVELGVAQRRHGRAIAHGQPGGRVLAVEMQLEALEAAVEALLDGGAAQGQPGWQTALHAHRAAPVGIGAPVVVGQLEALLSLGWRGQQLVAIAAPAQAPGLVGTPGVHAAAQVELARAQGRLAAFGRCGDGRHTGP
jgi:hypothetical protein